MLNKVYSISLTTTFFFFFVVDYGTMLFHFGMNFEVVNLIDNLNPCSKNIVLANNTLVPVLSG